MSDEMILFRRTLGDGIPDYIVLLFAIFAKQGVGLRTVKDERRSGTLNCIYMMCLW
jgi:hypothetical protein